ncbi:MULTISPECIES: LysR family transcriptional regulator [unclassified Rhizobium]|uniref:LysR family transcriptional regulator n=1 Tax=unclassified Rhizobium TaxID=2613769 RepID=UPI001ADCAB9A|nr:MULTISPECIES: LysR family transcriptional regulator [unclassified Rhizobium]MBO9123394.1 LysR family transcriptional regulator [Rhizobium sp. 16-488-2b]MBO9173926.1 LysR family transcriptional regulator [Rhizobium sp. 16-488-2a]
MKRVRSTDLAIFLAIANHRSFRKAAVELAVTPSALSHALRAIEERLEVRLVNRTTRGVALTEAGERLFDRIRPAFLDIDAALDDLDTFRGQPYGKLRINTPRAAAKLVLLPIASRFLKAHPSVEVDIVIDDALVDMVSSGFDAGIRFGESIAADMIAVPIGPRHSFAVVGTPGYFEGRGRPQTPHDLKDHVCIRFRFAGGAFYHWEFERGGIELEIEVRGPLTLGDQDIMRDAVLQGDGLGYLFEDQVRDEIETGKLVRVLEDWCPYYPGFFLYYPSRRQLPTALRAFIDFVKAERDRAQP